MKKIRLFAGIFVPVLLLLPFTANAAYIVSIWGDGVDGTGEIAMTQVGTTNQHIANITIPNFTGNLSNYQYWIGNNGWEDGRSANVSLSTAGLPADCDGSFTVSIYSTSSGTNYSPTFSVEPYLSVYASNTYITASVNSFLLIADYGNGTPTSYNWEMSVNGGQTWSSIGTSSASSFTISRGDTAFPTDATQYRVIATFSGTPVTSANVSTVSVATSCSSQDAPIVVFKQDFGTITKTDLDNASFFFPNDRPDHLYQWRRDFSDVGIAASMPDYEYRPYPYKINDGYYALVADPYWCGCGDGKNAPNEAVTACTPDPRTTAETEGTSNWYRGYQYPTSSGIKFRDHTLNEPSDTKDEYGLCLMINYKEGDAAVAYEHVLSDTEKAQLTPGSTVRLTAFIASIAKEWSGSSVSMTLNLHFRANNSTTWTLLSTTTQEVHHHENWAPLITPEFELGTQQGDYRLQVVSSGLSGRGNDVLIDDISLEVCQPKIAIYMTDEDGDSDSAMTITKEDDEFAVVVPPFDASLLGNDPGLMIFYYNPATGAYDYLGDMAARTSGGTTQYEYTINIDNLADRCSLGSANFVGVATTGAIMGDATQKQDLIDGIEHGTIDPADDNVINAYRTDDFVTLNIQCPTEQAALAIVGASTPQSMTTCVPASAADYPDLTLTFDHLANQVTAKLLQDGNEVGDIALSAAEITAGSKTISLADYATALAWTGGNTYEIGVSLTETLAGCSTPTCTQSATTVSVNVITEPSFVDPLPATQAVCGSEGISVTANVANANTYVWEYSTDDGATWSAAPGATNSATYVFPSNSEQGWLFRLSASYESGNLSCGPVVSTNIEVSGGVIEQPVVHDYNECPVAGTYDLLQLVDSYQGTLEWTDADGNVITDTNFDTSATGSSVYRVTAVDGECRSTTMTINVNVKDRAVAADLQGAGMEVCTGQSATLTASTTLTDGNLVFTWYSSQDLTDQLGTGESLAISGPESSATYYVTVQGDNTCENLAGDAYEITVTGKDAVTGITLLPEAESIGLGGEVTKTLTVTPADAGFTVVWSANGNVVTPNTLAYTEKPYVDSAYEVTVTDECGNTMQARATATVQWPTVFTPHVVDGANDDFLGGMNDIHLQVFDRHGNVLFEGTGGWLQQNAATHSPGVYYYIATLPDGNVKKGTIEIYK